MVINLYSETKLTLTKPEDDGFNTSWSILGLIGIILIIIIGTWLIKKSKQRKELLLKKVNNINIQSGPVAKIVPNTGYSTTQIANELIGDLNFCSQCGNKITPTQNFCNRCGSKINRDE